MEKETKNLIEGLLDEMNRAREMITEYQSLPKNAGAFTCMMIQKDISRAEKAIVSGDTIQMIACYKVLKEYES